VSSSNMCKPSKTAVIGLITQGKNDGNCRIEMCLTLPESEPLQRVSDCLGTVLANSFFA
ncbi:hypothetical protein J6590_100155, partial [Homalodisca vitripennis]